MKPLKLKVNTNPPVGTYPFGASPFGTLRNNPGDSSGTPVDVDLVEDVMIFMEALMAAGGVTPNNVVDTNAVPQLLQALSNLYNAAIAVETTRAEAAELALQNQMPLAKGSVQMGSITGPGHADIVVAFSSVGVTNYRVMLTKESSDTTILTSFGVLQGSKTATGFTIRMYYSGTGTVNYNSNDVVQYVVFPN